MKLTIDFETRSELELPKVGAWIYSLHPSTDALLLGWRADYMEIVLRGQWKLGDPKPQELFSLIGDIGYIEAHNAQFEMYIWENVCHRKYGWPRMNFLGWRCSAAKAAAHSIPRSLGDAGRAMKLSVVKDVEQGKWTMLKMARPRKPTKVNPARWHEAPEDWAMLKKYNMTDVESEHALSSALPDLSPKELRLWQLTERMNLRGVPVDVEGVKAAVKIAGEYARRLTEEFQKITGLETAGQRAKFAVWLSGKGFAIENTQADTLDALLAGGKLESSVARAVAIVRQLGQSSIKKYRAELEQQSGGRVRGTFLYFGAQATGRWAGRGVQYQNFKRDAVVKSQELAWRMIKEGGLDVIELVAEPLEFLSGALRGSICAPPGKTLRVGDFSQIECRVVHWLAGDEDGLRPFRRGEDPYLEMASVIFNRPVVKAESDKRFLGKQARLALGFEAGFVKFLVHCRALGAPRFTAAQIREAIPSAGQRETILAWIMSEAWDQVTRLIPDADREDAEELVLTKHVVDLYRKKYVKVTKLWRACENAARAAVKLPGKTYVAGKLRYKREGNFLKCRLPSGRWLHYPFTEINARGELTYMREANGQWVRDKTYGGKLVANATQATARDVEADAMLRLEGREEYRDIVLSVHDDIACECDPNRGSIEEFLALMSQPPGWCQDLPIAVEGYEERRYRK